MDTTETLIDFEVVPSDESSTEETTTIEVKPEATVAAATAAATAAMAIGWATATDDDVEEEEEEEEADEEADDEEAEAADEEWEYEEEEEAQPEPEPELGVDLVPYTGPECIQIDPTSTSVWTNVQQSKKIVESVKTVKTVSLKLDLERFNGKNVHVWRTDVEEYLDVSGNRCCIQREPNADDPEDMARFKKIRYLLQTTIDLDLKIAAKAYETPKALYDWVLSFDDRSMLQKYDIFMGLSTCDYLPWPNSPKLAKWLQQFEGKIHCLEQLGMPVNDQIKCMLLTSAMCSVKFWPIHNEMFAKETVDYEEFKKRLLQVDMLVDRFDSAYCSRCSNYGHPSTHCWSSFRKNGGSNRGTGTGTDTTQQR